MHSYTFRLGNHAGRVLRLKAIDAQAWDALAPTYQLIFPEERLDNFVVPTQVS